MTDEITPDSPEAFEAEIRQLIGALQSELGDGESRWFYDEPTETLYIELEHIQNLDEAIIEQKAAPILDACEIDFEEIILLPLAK